MRRSFDTWIHVLLELTVVLGWTTALHAQDVAPASRSTVVVLDGAGNYYTLANMTKRLVCEEGRAIDVVVYEWSHGHRKIIADQTDFCWHQAHGARLAEQLRELRSAKPSQPIHLVVHSAGVQSTMVALESLPPGSVQRVILLHPSNSHSYDVRQALQAVDEMHVHYSCRDWLYMGVGMRVIGTTDRRFTAAAGRKGYTNPFVCSDPESRSKLHQRRWHFSDIFLGNWGDHSGALRHDFMRSHVMPLLGS